LFQLGIASGLPTAHSGIFVAYDHMLADAPDLVVFLGDYICEMGATQSETAVLGCTQPAKSPITEIFTSWPNQTHRSNACMPPAHG
jgi:phosphodiesterase/alkaline phosphatase D-like protein